MRKLLVALIVLAVLAVGGDRLAARLVAEEVESQLATRGVTGAEVRIDGFPFLTQALRKQFEHVTITADSVSRSGLVADDVRADLRDVRLTSSSSGTAGQATGSGVVPWSEVASAANLPLRMSAGPGNEVRIGGDVNVLGQTVGVAADASVTLRDGAVLVRPTRITVDGGGVLPAPVTQEIEQQFTLSYPVPGLPDGVRLTGLTVEQAGLRIAVAAENVTVR